MTALRSCSSPHYIYQLPYLILMEQTLSALLRWILPIRSINVEFLSAIHFAYVQHATI